MIENREKDNIYIVPFIGGLLCTMTVISPPFFLFFGLIPVITSLLELICGLFLIYYAIKIKRGKSMWIEEQIKILIFSWIAFSVSLGISFSFLLGVGSFFIVYDYGFAGSLITLLGYYFHNYISNRNPIIVRGGDKFEHYSKKERIKYTNPRFCPHCRFKLEKWLFDFCPNCNKQLTAK